MKFETWVNFKHHTYLILYPFGVFFMMVCEVEVTSSFDVQRQAKLLFNLHVQPGMSAPWQKTGILPI
jgi:hypothetical protein